MNKSLFNRKPLFGMIPADGGGWSVNCVGDERGTSALSGYGDFPRERFPSIPVVDCRTVTSFVGFPDFPVEHYGRQSRFVKYPTLSEFIERARKCGATIL